MSVLRVPSTCIWGLLAALALLWPDRIHGPFDGVPLEGVAEAIVIGIVFPTLWWFHPDFLRTRNARLCIVALLGWKVFAAGALVQDGWCVRFAPTVPFVKDGKGAPHSWDLRADWRSENPACSAIVTRPYNQFSDFPAWFFNLPPPIERPLTATERPPGAVTGMTVTGFLRPVQTGVLGVVTGSDLAAATVRIDGAQPPATDQITLAEGIHTVTLNATLTGDRWVFAPLWNGTSLWSGAIATLKRPSRLDIAVRRWGTWLPTALVATLLLAWLASAAAWIQDANVFTWMIGAAASIASLVLMEGTSVERWLTAGLFMAALVRVPNRLKNLGGAFALVGVPWLTLIVMRSLPAIGRFTLYEWGDDYWTFQRFAYRIYMQGYWLEGGSATFWFQPLYRWIAGALHLIFGDSSVGESYWDGVCLLAGALFAFQITKAFAGFRWGLIAAATSLAVFMWGPTSIFIGRGLSEISSAGFLYLAALVALRSRHRNWPAAIAAGAFATLAFYTRLNNLPMAFAVALFALSVRFATRALTHADTWMRGAFWRTATVVTATLAIGLLLFAWRTWHYTGVFSVTYGTQASFLSIWQPGTSPGTLLARMAESVMMVLTMNDPPRFEPFALPLMLGALTAVLALAGVPLLRELPLASVSFALAGISGALVARGSAYPGRFSIHLIAVTSALVVCTMALGISSTVRRAARRRGDRSAARFQAT